MRARALLSLVGVMVLSGCAADYRMSLRDYRNPVPTVYLTSTLRLMESGKKEARTSESIFTGAGSTTTTLNLARLATEQGTVEDAQARVAAAVLHMNADEVAQSLAPLRDAGTLRERLVRGVDWPTLQVAVVLHNPAVRAGGEAWQAALRQFEQADALETLAGQYRALTRYLEVEPGNQMNRQMALTYVPSPGVLGYKGEMVRQMARMAELDWQMALRDQLVEVGQAFYEYQYNQRALKVATENRDLLKDLLRVVEESYRTGAGTQNDVLRLQTVLARQENEIRDMQAMRHAQAARIVAAVGLPSDVVIGPADDVDAVTPKLTSEQVGEEAARSRQEVQVAEARTRRTVAAIRMGEIMNRPPASQGYSVLERGMMGEAEPGVKSEGGASNNGMSAAPGGTAGGFGVKNKAVARPQYAQSEAYLAEMRSRLESEQSQLEQARNAARGQAIVMARELENTARKEVLVRGTVLRQTEFSYHTARAGYTAGEGTFVDLLDAERMFLDARMELQQARRDRNVAIVKLAMNVGHLLRP